MSVRIASRVVIHMANVLLSFLVCIAVTVLFVGMGVYMLVSGDATLLHSYHRADVLAQDLAPLARWSGVGAIMIGAGVLLLSLPFLAKIRPLPNWTRGKLPVVFGGVLLLGGFLVITASVVYYNGAIIAS
jgi:hypothetical protein